MVDRRAERSRSYLLTLAAQVGWSILNILCDFTGGVLSLYVFVLIPFRIHEGVLRVEHSGQMLIDAHLSKDWAGLASNPGKL